MFLGGVSSEPVGTTSGHCQPGALHNVIVFTVLGVGHARLVQAKWSVATVLAVKRDVCFLAVKHDVCFWDRKNVF